MKAIICSFVSFILTAAVFAVPPTLPNDATYFVDPEGWNAGDLNSTYQEWDTMFDVSGNLPDVGYAANPSVAVRPGLSVLTPGYLSAFSNFYSFNGNYEVYADIYNHGGSSGAGGIPAGYGTHVIVQVLATLQIVPIGIYPDTLRIVDFTGTVISGGSNAEALRVDRICNILKESPYYAYSMVDAEETIYEFYLPNYTGDFRVRYDVNIHSSMQQIQVDTMLAPEPFEITPIPGPRDIDDDNDVDFVDYSMFSNHWLCSDPNYIGDVENGSEADFDLDGEVSIGDLLEFYNYWLEGTSIQE